MRSPIVRFVVLCLLIASGRPPHVILAQSRQLTIVNPGDFFYQDALVEIDLAKLAPHKQSNATFVVSIEGREIPAQRQGDKLFVCLDLKPAARQLITVQIRSAGAVSPVYPARVHAELSPKRGGQFVAGKYVGGQFESVTHERVPAEHIDHDNYYRYEGPGWESEKVGYRFYLDWRNRLDIFGKKVPRIVLPEVGLDGFDSYHSMADWGMDIFKVGESVGIGSMALLQNAKLHFVSKVDSLTCRILADGPVVAQIGTSYSGWQVADQKLHLESLLSISAGSRLTRHEISITGKADSIATGLAKTAGCQFLTDGAGPTSAWHYIALWGPQSLAGDNLGTALFYRQSHLLALREDELNQLVLLRPDKGRLDYYFAAAWEQEPEGIKNPEDFKKYLEQVRAELNHPPVVEYR